jgi:hypothetical protein
MPTVLRVGRFRFHFYSRENDEPPHIHVANGDVEAKFWLSPIALAANYGFNRADLGRIRRIIGEHCEDLMTAYNEFHG